MEALKARQSPLLELPQLDALAHLIDWLGELGIYGQGHNGPTALTFAEIQAWQQTTGVQLPAQEALLLRRLSEDYCHEYAASSDPARPAPYSPDGPIKAAPAQSIFAALRQAIKG